MVSAGSKIDTSFKLKVVRNGEETEVYFSELLDKPAVVSVYMKNNTSGCDKQNNSLAEHADKIRELGYNLIAISKDSCGSHKKYAEKRGINYILASDPEFAFAKAANSIIEKKMYGKTFSGPSRSAFVIDTSGRVKAVIEKVNTKEHGQEILTLLKSIA